VIANNYCTMAKMSKVHFDELIYKYPKLVPKFKEKIFHYDDNVKLFLEKSLDSIEYLKNTSNEIKHELLYKLKKLNFKKGGSLINFGEVATRMFIIQNGTVEIEHQVENEPFIIEKLTRGCILNHRSFLLADENDTNARCATTVTVYALEFEDFDNIR
jgi:CRP-like cAMP-binding protein